MNQDINFVNNAEIEKIVLNHFEIDEQFKIKNIGIDFNSFKFECVKDNEEHEVSIFSVGSQFGVNLSSKVYYNVDEFDDEFIISEKNKIKDNLNNFHFKMKGFENQFKRFFINIREPIIDLDNDHNYIKSLSKRDKHFNHSCIEIKAVFHFKELRKEFFKDLKDKCTKLFFNQYCLDNFKFIMNDEDYNLFNLYFKNNINIYFHPKNLLESKPMFIFEIDDVCKDYIKFDENGFIEQNIKELIILNHKT